VYEPGLASRTPVDGSIVKLAPTLNPPRTVDEAIGNVYAEGMLGLFRICANPDVASQSGWTGAVLLRVILLLAPSHVTDVSPLPVISMSSSLLSASRSLR